MISYLQSLIGLLLIFFMFRWPGENNISQSVRKQLPEEQNSEFIKESLPELLSLLAGVSIYFFILPM